MRYVFPTSHLQRYRFPTHTNDLVIDRADATNSEAFFVVLEPGEAPPIHKHEDTEQIFYMLEGKGSLRVGEEQKEYFVNPTDVVRIPPGVLHSIKCTGNEPIRYLGIDCFVNGKPESEATWDLHVKVQCQQQGWNYEKVVK
jgi:quercetin dioxygenase-like cupin family protein